jgi:hypothetical protein
VTAETAPLMTDADLQATLRRAQRTIAILGVILAAVFAIAAGWQSGLLALVGAVISWTGIREWRGMTTVLAARLDNEQPARPVGRTLVTFFLRLAAAAAALYVSLRCLHGTVYALVSGLGLAMVALAWEALRHLRG